jgi:hypothetical protein
MEPSTNYRADLAGAPGAGKFLFRREKEEPCKRSRGAGAGGQETGRMAVVKRAAAGGI